MAESKSEDAEQAAARLSFESQFAELRDVLDGIPGIRGTLSQRARESLEADPQGGWIQCFDIEPSQEGIDALVGLTETLDWCSEHHAQLGLPPFAALVAFAGGFVLDVTPTDPPPCGGLAIPPDVLARAIRDNYAHCVEANNDEARRWDDLMAGCVEDCRRSRPEWADLDTDRFGFDLLDGETSLVAVLLDGRPIARYRFKEVGGAYEWHRVDSTSSTGGGES